MFKAQYKMKNLEFRNKSDTLKANVRKQQIQHDQKNHGHYLYNNKIIKAV